jgi:hypothetical protein
LQFSGSVINNESNFQQEMLEQLGHFLFLTRTLMTPSADAISPSHPFEYTNVQCGILIKTPLLLEMPPGKLQSSVVYLSKKKNNNRDECYPARRL